jgi:2-polyprenyl-3-methyl-5-hydroxy-6-metoxy-1,4-benzoquinol methylase
MTHVRGRWCTTCGMYDPAQQWERFGRVDPYYGVVAREEFRSANLDEAHLARFFATGEQHVAEVLASARRVAGDEFAPESILDHGCGVGRLLVPFSQRAGRVVGVDVSASMLEEARRNCLSHGANNVELVPAARLATLKPEFDLVHSYIVLQHIPRRAGLRIIETLATLLRPGGVGVMHMPIAAPSLVTSLHTWTTRTIPFAYSVSNVLHGRPWSYPHMQMNVYSLDAIAKRLRGRGFEQLWLELDGGSPGAYTFCTVLFRRPS